MTMRQALNIKLIPLQRQYASHVICRQYSWVATPRDYIKANSRKGMIWIV